MDQQMQTWDGAKKVLAKHAAAHVKPGMTLGVGSGSTVSAYIDSLAPWAGKVQCVAASLQSEEHLRSLGLEVADIDTVERVEFSVDGADAVNERHDMIKGGGASLVRERLVLSRAERALILVDASKPCPSFVSVTVPVAILPFSWRATFIRLQRYSENLRLRKKGNAPLVTDDGLYIADLPFERIDDPGQLHQQLKMLEGVVDTGIMVGYDTTVWVSDGSSVWSM